MTKTFPIRCHVCGRDFDHEAEFLSVPMGLADGRLVGTCNFADKDAHTADEIRASYALLTKAVA